MITGENSDPQKVGKTDFTIDLRMWPAIAEAVKVKINAAENNGDMPKNSVIITDNWFPAAHLDYYYAIPNHKKLYILSTPDHQHEFRRINIIRGETKKQCSAYYMTTSQIYSAPDTSLIATFEKVEGPEILAIKTRNKTRVNLFIWKLRDLKNDYQF